MLLVGIGQRGVGATFFVKDKRHPFTWSNRFREERYSSEKSVHTVGLH